MKSDRIPAGGDKYVGIVHIPPLAVQQMLTTWQFLSEKVTYSSWDADRVTATGTLILDRYLVNLSFSYLEGKAFLAKDLWKHHYLGQCMKELLHTLSKLYLHN